MKNDLTEKPREFGVTGHTIRDYGKIRLAPWEMVSFVSPDGRECDFTATDWGFYLAPSLNGRLRNQGFKTALVENSDGKFFLNAVEEDKIMLFEQYLEEQGSTVVSWLSDPE